MEAIQEAEASMGPRLVRRGKEALEAEAKVVPDALQWGLVLLDEESGGRQSLLRGGRVASMGPRLVRRGKANGSSRHYAS